MSNIIWINGCFDILHRGHIELFKHAHSLGDTVLVGIDSDKKIKKEKGKKRPFNNQKDRKEILKSIKYIDKVFIFNTPQELENLIKFYTPDIMIIGSDWKGKTIIGSQYAKKINFFNRIEKYSTSIILKDKITPKH